APGAEERILRRYGAPSLAFSPAPIHMAKATAECDLVICHAGSGTVGASLLAGRPLVLMPLHLEQSLTARNVVKLGAGVMADDDVQSVSYRRIVTEALRNPVYKEQATSFARRYADFDQNRQIERIAARCGDLLSYAATPRTDSFEPWR